MCNGAGFRKDNHEKIFATAINCMDGRTQLPLIRWIKNEYCVDYVDMITEPGVVKYISSNSQDVVSRLKDKVLISVNMHGSKIIVIAAHYDCAGNPVEKEVQIKQLKDSVDLVKSWNLGIDVVGVWINENWQPEKIVE